MLRNMAAALFACVLVVTAVNGADNGLKKGTPDLQQAGPLAFGPDGVLFIGDARSAAVFAVDTGDASGDASKVSINVENLDSKIAGMLGATARIGLEDLLLPEAHVVVLVERERRRVPPRHGMGPGFGGMQPWPHRVLGVSAHAARARRQAVFSERRAPDGSSRGTPVLAARISHGMKRRDPSVVALLAHHGDDEKLSRPRRSAAASTR